MSILTFIFEWFAKKFLDKAWDKGATLPEQTSRSVQGRRRRKLGEVAVASGFNVLISRIDSMPTSEIMSIDIAECKVRQSRTGDWEVRSCVKRHFSREQGVEDQSHRLWRMVARYDRSTLYGHYWAAQGGDDSLGFFRLEWLPSEARRRVNEMRGHYFRLKRGISDTSEPTLKCFNLTLIHFETLKDAEVEVRRQISQVLTSQSAPTLS